jgi:hypothetical protein
MAKLYTKNTWVDEVLAGAERYDILEDGGGAYKSMMRINLATSVLTAGSPVDASRMNNLEDGLDAVDTRLSNLAAGTGDALPAGAIASNAITTAKILDANVTLAKLANVATASVFYRKTAGSGVPEVQTLATLKTDLGLTGTNSGDETAARIWDIIANATDKATPLDNDVLALADNNDDTLKSLTWANLKTAIVTAWGALVNGLTSKATPVDNDAITLMDSAASNATKKLTWANIKATLVQTMMLGANMEAATVSSGATVGVGFYGGTQKTSLQEVQVSIPVAVTAKKLTVVLQSAQPGTGSLVFTLVDNITDTALVLTVAAGSAAGAYSATGSVSLAADAKISLKIKNNASGASGAIAGIAMSVEKSLA